MVATEDVEGSKDVMRSGREAYKDVAMSHWILSVSQIALPLL